MNYRLLSLVLALLLALTLSLLGLQITGFSILPLLPAETGTVEVVSPSPALRTAISPSVPSPTLHYEILSPTELTIHPPSVPLERCPKPAVLIFGIENAGSHPAEKLFVMASPAVQVLSCEGCEVPSIASGATHEVTLSVCSEKKQDAVFTFHSVNTDPVSVSIG